jgi:hypothetical protein
MARRRWRGYAGSEVDHFATFCREHLIQSEDRWEGKPLVLEPWQRRMMAPVQIARGVPVTQVAAQLGHSRKSLTLDVYSHVLMGD